MSKLSIEKLDSKIFARFGRVIQKNNASELRSINQGTTTRYHNISELSLESKNGHSGISVFSGTPRSFPIEIKIMEKHPIASQSFLPIQNYDWLIVVSEEKNELPDKDVLKNEIINKQFRLTLPPLLACGILNGLTRFHAQILLQLKNFLFFVGNKGIYYLNLL